MVNCWGSEVSSIIGAIERVKSYVSNSVNEGCKLLGDMKYKEVGKKVNKGLHDYLSLQ